MNKDEKEKKLILENREAMLLVSLENIRQRCLNLLYGSEKAPSEIIREAVDDELLELEAKQGRARFA